MKILMGVTPLCRDCHEKMLERGKKSTNKFIDMMMKAEILDEIVANWSNGDHESHGNMIVWIKQQIEERCLNTQP
jgi:hypothetical protein